MAAMDENDMNGRAERGPRARAGAAVSHQQMSLAPSYPIDRYLVENSKEIEMIKILDDDIWNEEPLMRPEDDILLRKLQDMLQSTAEQLKELSVDLNKPQEPIILVKSLPTPLDEAFNEKVHIEEIVKAKFHGHKIVESTQQVTRSPPVINLTPNITPMKSKTTKVTIPIQKKLQISKTRIVHIDEAENLVEIKQENPKKIESVCYNEFSYKYEPNILPSNSKLKVQHMPSVSIRSELKQQKVLQVDIMPESKDETDNRQKKNNVAVVQVEYHNASGAQPKYHQDQRDMDRSTIRKVTKMSTYDTSESISPKSRTNLKTTKTIAPNKSSARSNMINRKENKKEHVQNRPGTSLEQWKRRLNSVYGHSSDHKRQKTAKVKKPKSSRPDNQRVFNNGEYVPYSQLTLGGVRLSDIENELSDSALKNDTPLSEILDKILSSKENSPRKQNKPNVVLSKSDEDLLNEVLDVESKVSAVLSKDVKKKKEKEVVKPPSSESSKDSNDTKENENYDDDFEAADKSENTESSKEKKDGNSPDESNAKSTEDSLQKHDEKNKVEVNLANTTFTKQINLSLKRTVDVYEYLHAVDRQDSATQSPTTRTISLKGTQTSPTEDPGPRNDPITAIHNMFRLEKEFIKKLIIEEYGDILDQHKASTSKDTESKCIPAPHRHTQTSPARVKGVMTSPTRTRDRMTSPLELPPPAATPPPAPEDISVNLSSPRFNLRLPTRRRGETRGGGGGSSSTTDADLSSDVSSLGEVTARLRRQWRGGRGADVTTSTAGSSSGTDSALLLLRLRSEGEVSSGAARRPL